MTDIPTEDDQDESSPEKSVFYEVEDSYSEMSTAEYRPSLIGDIDKPLKTDYDPTEDREKVRGNLAQGLIILLAIVVIIPFLALMMGKEIADVKAIVEVTLTPLVGLVGAVTGFYFGSKE